MSNPLNEQVAQLISEILKLETERERQLRIMEGMGLLGNISNQFRQLHITYFQTLDDLTRKIDYGRQKLISLELLMLDNSIKSLHSTTGQVVASSVKLEETTNRVAASSIKLEDLTKVLIYVTVLVGIVTVFSAAVAFIPINPFVGFVGIVACLIAMIYLWLKVLPLLRRKPLG